MRDLVSVQLAIAIFKAFSDVSSIASSSTSSSFVYDPEFKFLDFIR